MRVVIADDSVLLREGLRRLLAEAGIETVASVGDGEALEAAVPGVGNPFGIKPLPKLVMMSRAACAPFPELISSYHFRPCGVASRPASPPVSCGKKPMPSEWSATTMKSSGRESFARCPLEAITSSPLAKRYASLGPSRAPNAPASIEYEVCVCVSPKYGRVGKLRPAYGE